MAASHITKDINGAKTDILLQTYSDRTLVLVTQLGKVGNLIQVSIPDTTPIPPTDSPSRSDPNVQPSLPRPPAAIQLTSLLGSAPSEHLQTLHSLYASQIATIIWSTGSSEHLVTPRRSVVVGIALRKPDGAGGSGFSPREREVFVTIMSMLQELLQRS